jgi:arylsulfatase A-like enzyme
MLTEKPNIIYTLVDDLGDVDPGASGNKKIESPDPDDLAINGVRYIHHYAGAPVCAPS